MNDKILSNPEIIGPGMWISIHLLAKKCSNKR